MEKDFISLGMTTNHYADARVFLSSDARVRHTFVVGQTGTGKTTLLQRMAIDDLHQGNGIMFLDPHGDAAEELTDYIPESRMDDVIYLRPADTDRAFGFNLLENVLEKDRDRVTQEVVSTFRYRWADSWGSRMENIFKHSVRALLDVPERRGGATLLMLPMFLNRKDYRNQVLKDCRSRAVRDFFRLEFDKWNDRQLTEFVQPILNKVDQFLLSDTVRNIVGQAKSTIDLDYIMNNRKVLIANLDKGAIGADDANMIGSLLVTGCQLAAMRRSALPPGQRQDFYAYLDEFHSFTTGSFASILSESRKYRLGMILAGQYLEQIEHPQVKAAVFGNCGNFCCFRVSNEDAETLSPTLQQRVDFLEDLPTGQAALKLLVDGHPQVAKLWTERIDPAMYVGRSTRVKRAARRYTTPIDEIVERQTRWAKRIRMPTK